MEDTVCGDGSFCMSFDLPGVCGDDILVLPNENEVKFYGENKEVYEQSRSWRIGGPNLIFFTTSLFIFKVLAEKSLFIFPLYFFINFTKKYFIL